MNVLLHGSALIFCLINILSKKAMRVSAEKLKKKRASWQLPA